MHMVGMTCLMKTRFTVLIEYWQYVMPLASDHIGATHLVLKRSAATRISEYELPVAATAK